MALKKPQTSNSWCVSAQKLVLACHQQVMSVPPLCLHHTPPAINTGRLQPRELVSISTHQFALRWSSTLLVVWTMTPGSSWYYSTNTASERPHQLVLLFLNAFCFTTIVEKANENILLLNTKAIRTTGTLTDLLIKTDSVFAHFINPLNNSQEEADLIMPEPKQWHPASAVTLLLMAEPGRRRQPWICRVKARTKPWCDSMPPGQVLFQLDIISRLRFLISNRAE